MRYYDKPSAKRRRAGKLGAFDFGEHFAVRLGVGMLKIFEQAAAFAHFAKESSARRVILLVLLKMLAQFRDFGSENADLHLRRTCVVRVRGILFDKILLLLFAKHNSLFGRKGE